MRLTSQDHDLRRACLTSGSAVALLAAAAAAAAGWGLPGIYLWTQDLPVLALLAALLLAAGLIGVPEVRLPSVPLGWRALAALSIALGLALWAGTYWIMYDYPATRDEHMVVFDAAILARGRLAWPLPVEWRSSAQALVPAFLLQLPSNAAWVSSYMPGNALLRATFGALLDPALMNPLLATVGAAALYNVARRLFTNDRPAAVVVVLLYLTSAQMLVTSMTAYAMTAHLALNLVWLALFLRGTRLGHAGAIGVGFIATGLHQVVFHPLFVAPFLNELRKSRQWTTLAVYCASYAAIGLFWLAYPALVIQSLGLPAGSGSMGGPGSFLSERVMPLLVTHDPQTAPLTLANLTRFIAWENFALLPLCVLAIPAVRRADGIARPLFGGIVLTIGAMIVLLPYQGHGWGYRYLHGLIGSAALLGGYGWHAVRDRREGRSFLAVATAATALISIPWLAWRAHEFVRPYAGVNQMIEQIDADMVIVETEGTAFGIDEVRNQPDLSNRPIRLAGKALRPTDIAGLCRRGSIAFVDVARMQSAGLGVGNGSNSRHFAQLRAAAVKSCPAAVR